MSERKKEYLLEKDGPEKSPFDSGAASSKDERNFCSLLLTNDGEKKEREDGKRGKKSKSLLEPPPHSSYFFPLFLWHPN